MSVAPVLRIASIAATRAPQGVDLPEFLKLFSASTKQGVEASKRASYAPGRRALRSGIGKDAGKAARLKCERNQDDAERQAHRLQ